MNNSQHNYLNDINWQAPWLLHVPEMLRSLHSYQFNNQLNNQCNNNAPSDQVSAQNNNSEQTPDSDIQSQPLAEVFNKLISGNDYYEKVFVNCNNLPLSFVSQDALDNVNHSMATAYETFIADTGQIPTRNNLHDLFNAWVWFTFPKTKILLNKHQAAQIAKDGISGSRGRVRDAITVLDENGAILITADESIADSLRNFDWQNTLVATRAQWDNPFAAAESTATRSTTSMLMICGHALMEQLVNPRKPLCSHTFILHVEAEFFALSMQERVRRVDDLLAEKVDAWLQQEDVSPRQLSPLPILGVPHYWHENENLEFYNDDYVFRSGRRKSKRTSAQ